MKKYKVTFLLNKRNLWIEKQLRNYNFKLKHRYIFKFSKNHKKVKKQDIVFPINYTKILTEDFLKDNKLTLIAHNSRLPQDKGFAPLQYQILKNKKKTYISLIQAVKKVDAGPIFLQNSFILDGTELIDELRNIQGKEIIKIIKHFLILYPNVKSKKQKGIGNLNKKRTPRDSQLNINKTLKQQFNHFRINDNKLYPSFFYYKNIKYIIKIYKEEKKK